MSDFWIKVCGLQRAEEVAAALEAGVDAIGLVLAESVRKLSPVEAAELAEQARGRAQVVVVMRHPTVAECEAVFATFTPDIVQTDAADFEGLQVPTGVARLPVYRDGEAAPPRGLRCLYESARSGRGETANWQRAGTLASKRRLILAGGLSPDNVADAIAAVNPAGVDVSSGVEFAPGVKDPEKIFRFVVRAREAAQAA